VLRAQLSSEEQLLLFYNGLSDYGRRRFKQLIETYSLLEQLDDSQLLSEAHKQYYNPSAWTDRDRVDIPVPDVKPIDLENEERKVLFIVLKMAVGVRRSKGVDLRDEMTNWINLGVTVYTALQSPDGSRFIPAAKAFDERLRKWSRLNLDAVQFADINNAIGEEGFASKTSEDMQYGALDAVNHRIQRLMHYRDTVYKTF
jgi:hypothetical protein